MEGQGRIVRNLSSCLILGRRNRGQKVGSRAGNRRLPVNVEQTAVQYRDRAYRRCTEDDFLGELLPFLTGFGVSSASDSETFTSESIGERREALQINS